MDEDKEDVDAITIVDKGNGRFKPAAKTLRSGTRVLDQTIVEDQHAQALIERRNRFVESDPIVKTVDAGGDAVAILRGVKREIVREAASLAFDRVEAERKNKDTSATSMRRIEALRRIADIELKLRELDQHSVNLSSEKMQRVFALWVETMQQVAQDVLSTEVMELYFNRFATAMDGWEERAQDTLRQ
jgi:hypothetical protein